MVVVVVRLPCCGVSGVIDWFRLDFSLDSIFMFFNFFDPLDDCPKPIVSNRFVAIFSEPYSVPLFAIEFFAKELFAFMSGNGVSIEVKPRVVEFGIWTVFADRLKGRRIVPLSTEIRHRIKVKQWKHINILYILRSNISNSFTVKRIIQIKIIR